MAGLSGTGLATFRRAGATIARSRFGDRVVLVFAALELIVLWKLWGVSQVREIADRHLSRDYGLLQHGLALAALAALVASFVSLLHEPWSRIVRGRTHEGAFRRGLMAAIVAAYLTFVASSLAWPVATFQTVTAATAVCFFLAFLNALAISLRRSACARWILAAVAVLLVTLHSVRSDEGDVLALIDSPARDGLGEYYRTLDFAKVVPEAPAAYRCTETEFPTRYGKDLESAFLKANAMRDFDYQGSKPENFLTDFKCLSFLRRFGPRGRWFEVRRSFEFWLAARPDRETYAKAGRPYPVFLVSAQGGGIYAAAHVSLFLARLQDACPSFAQHVFVISSVSGGSIGATIFGSAVAGDTPVSTLGCSPPSAGSNHEARVARFVGSDFLTPVIDATLASDLVNGLLMARNKSWRRADVLERYFRQTWLDQNGGRDLWSEGVAASWRPGTINPAILFNVTEVATGRRTVIAPFGAKWDGDDDFPAFSRRLGDQIFVTDGFYRRGMTVGSAAVTSARFPFVTPPATISVGVPDPEHPEHRAATQFVDGGYADNSGAETLGELASLLSAGGEDIDLHVLSFTDVDEFHANVKGEPRYDPSIDIPYFYVTTDPSTRPLFGEVSGPLVAFAQARAFHADAAIRSLADVMSANCRNLAHVRCYAAPAFIRVPIDTKTLGLPLGWTLSRASVARLRSSMWSFARCPIKMPAGGFKDSDYMRRWLAPQEDSPEGQILRAVARDEGKQLDAEEARSNGDPAVAPSDLEALRSSPDCALVKIQQILSASLSPRKAKAH